MPSSPAAKKLFIGFGLVLAALAVVGLVGGGIGSAVLGRSPFISQPEIHLPPQPVFPGASRDKHLGLTLIYSTDPEVVPGEEVPGQGAEGTAEGAPSGGSDR